MEPSHLQRLLSIVDEVLQKHPDDQWSYLTEVCGDDTALRSEVTALLKSINTSESFWDKWQQWNEEQISALIDGESGDGDDRRGRQAGPWRLLRFLGRGGMGTVWLAQRADGSFDKQVALKVLHRGMESPATVERFIQERQILAKLDHPNIARLYDGGLTEDGHPWLAMEYIDGHMITEWCNVHHAPVSQRLDLFCQVCEAVQFAHRNLIVHRDLKPENMLVTAEGKVRILDFGIAKLLDESSVTEDRVRTQTGIRAMSLEYAAPEQITGEPITTATDVYALGLLLYELLTGRYPFDLEGKNLRQAEQVLLRQDATPPSTQFRGSADKTMQQMLRGDLDAITLKALRKEPALRYEGAGQLLEDIRRHQRHLPVIARRDSFRYLAGKFFRRHRTAMTVTLLVLAGAVSLMTYYTIQLARERDIARREAIRAALVSEFLVDMFNAADPGEARGETITAREILDIGSERIGALADQPEVQATMSDVIGQVYLHLGYYDEAYVHLSKALEIRTHVFGESHTEVAQSHFALATVLHDKGDYRSATPHFEKALEIYRLHPGYVSAEYAASLDHMGSVHQARRNHDTALAFMAEALAMRISLFGDKDPSVASSYNDLGIVHLQIGDLPEAIRAFRTAMEIIHLHDDLQDTPLMAQVQVNLGRALRDNGNYDEAEIYLRAGLETNKRIYGEMHLYPALALQHLARMYRDRGDIQAAEIAYDEALHVVRTAVGDSHTLVGQVLQEKAELYLLNDDLQRAELAFRNALAVYTVTLRTGHIYLAVAKRKLGSVLIQLDRFTEAEPLLIESLATAQALLAENETYPPYQRSVRNALEELVNLYQALGRIDDADHYRQLQSEFIHQ